MPKSFTYDELLLALAREAFQDEWPIDLTTTSVGASTGLTGVFAQLAYTSSGAVANKYHDIWVYHRRFRGTLSAVPTTTTSTLESGHDFVTDALKNATFKIVDGTGSGQESVITGNTNATPSVITHDDLTTDPDTTSVYEIYPNSSSSRGGDHIRSAKANSTSALTVSSGTMNWNPAIQSNATDSLVVMTQVERTDMLFTYDIEGSLLRGYINRVLRNMRSPFFSPTTMVVDGDMEDSGVDNWTDVGSPATKAKVDITDTQLMFGRQALQIAGGDGTGATSSSVPVDNAEQIYVAVLIDTYTASADVVLYDATNGNDLKSVTVSNTVPSLVYFSQSLASTTKLISIRLLCNGSAGFNVGPAWVWSGARKRHAADLSSNVAPARTIERGTDIKGAFALRPGQNTETDVYIIGDLEEIDFKVERDDRANLVNVVTPFSAYPTLLKVERRYPELTYDTDTTFAERDMVVQGAMYHVEMARYRRLLSSNPSLAPSHKADAREYARTYSGMLEGTGISLVEVMDESSRQLVRFR